MEQKSKCMYDGYGESRLGHSLTIIASYLGLCCKLRLTSRSVCYVRHVPEKGL